MSTEIILPALGESVTEGTVSRWLKEVGEEVAQDEALVEVSTDKVDTEIPSPVSGVLLEIRVEEDAVAAVGSVLGIVGAPSEAATPAAPAPTPAPAPAPAAPAPAPASAPSATPAPAAPTATAGADIVLPALGESVTEGTVSRWLKEIGETVELDEPIVEVSTDKVDTEIPSPAAGVLTEILVTEDSVAPVGAVLGRVGSAVAAPVAPVAPAAPAPTPVVPAAPAAPAPAPVVPTPVAEDTAKRATSPVSGYVTPLVRKIAMDQDVDLATVTGTGVGGRIRKEDVLAAAEAAKAAAIAAATPPVPAATAAPAAAPAVPASDQRGTTEKLPRLRKVVAARMTESLQVSAQLTATVEVDMSAISRLRAGVKDDFRKREGVGLTYLAFITKAVTELLKVYPKLNASMDLEAGTVTYHDAEHIGIAVDTPRGLLVPVIKDAGDMNLGGIAKKIADLAARTRDNQVTPDELGGGTFTITNYGSTGTLFDTPIINQPQVGILGTGALVKRPVVVTNDFGEDTIVVREMMYLSLTYDHRLVDGADASRFLAALKARLEGGAFGAELA